MKESFPEEYAAREKDKLRYRYPRGESYLDIIARLEPVIFEMERQKKPLLIIAHQVPLDPWHEGHFVDVMRDKAYSAMYS